MNGWKVYFDNGYVGIGTIPPDHHGVIAIAEMDPDHNWVFWFGKDWYILQKDGHWMGVDQAGMEDQVTSRLGELEFILQGRTLVPYEKYQTVIDKMIADCQPPKTGWHPNENL